MLSCNVRSIVVIVALLGVMIPLHIRNCEHYSLAEELPVKQTFKVDGHQAFVIMPRIKEQQKPIPWVWYAPTLPGLPETRENRMFEQFLAKGIAIAGIDVGESYGSPAGRKIYSALYNEVVTNRGFAPKVALLARSRGGLMLYSWACEHPESVVCIGPAEEMRKNVRAQLHELDPHGYVPELLSTRLGSSRSTATNVLDRLAHYDLLEEVGRGGFAKVFKGIDTRTGTVVAIKMATTDGKPDDERAIRREMDIYERLKQIQNPHLLIVRDIFREDGRYALVTEFADGGTLWDLTEADVPGQPRKAMDEATVKEISLAILDGLCALHENDIVHRDIKPENILRCDDTWKIADFGISKLRSSPVTGFTMQGAHSMPWAPPEQRDGAAAHPSADIYAMGRVMAFLLSGSVKVEDYTALHQKWWTVIKPCMSISPEERPDAQALRVQVSKLVV